MASDEAMSVISSMQDEEFDETDDGYYDHHHQPHSNLSRLSMCTSSMFTNNDDDDDVDVDVDDGMGMYMSRLSIESFDADEELSDEKEGEFNGTSLPELSSDSEKEPGTCYSLPATPPRRRRSRRGQVMGVKDYASENEASSQRGSSALRRNNWRKRRVNSLNRERTVNNGSCCLSGESDQSGGYGSGVVVITRPKGGRRSLCMGLEEMKACKDLGFELEHERMMMTTTLEMMMPSRVSLSASTLDTNTTNSSGGNSPIGNWRISSPGDDPRDVKARLKVWAQAVALASSSTSRQYTT